MPSRRPTDMNRSNVRNSPSVKPGETPPPPVSGSNGSSAPLHRLQNFTYVEIHRSQITNAPYNPRSISEYTRKRLKQQLERHGLVETLVWNERTGHLVGGHQRLSILDQVAESADFRLGVARIDVDLKQEMEINVALNNPHIQGAYDSDKFFAMLKLPEAPSAEAMGFTTADMEMEFGAIPEVHDAFAQAEKNITPVATDLKDLKARRAESKQRIEDDPANDADYYLMIVFRTGADKEAFLQHLDRPLDMRFMEADELEMYLKEQHLWRKSE
jgi:hypothetical protein